MSGGRPLVCLVFPNEPPKRPTLTLVEEPKIVRPREYERIQRVAGHYYRAYEDIKMTSEAEKGRLRDHFDAYKMQVEEEREKFKVLEETIKQLKEAERERAHEKD